MGNNASTSSGSAANTKDSFSFKNLLPNKIINHRNVDNRKVETTTKSPWLTRHDQFLNRYPLLMKPSRVYKNDAYNVNLLQSISEIDSQPTVDSYESSINHKSSKNKKKSQYNSKDCSMNNYNSIDYTESNEFARFPNTLTIQKLQNWFGDDLKDKVPYIDDCQFYDGDWYEVSNNVYGLIPNQISKSEWNLLPTENTSKPELINTSNAAKALGNICDTTNQGDQQYTVTSISNTASATTINNTYSSIDNQPKSARRRKTLCGCFKF